MVKLKFVWTYRRISEIYVTLRWAMAFKLVIIENAVVIRVWLVNEKKINEKDAAVSLKDIWWLFLFYFDWFVMWLECCSAAAVSLLPLLCLWTTLPLSHCFLNAALSKSLCFYLYRTLCIFIHQIHFILLFYLYFSLTSTTLCLRTIHDLHPAAAVYFYSFSLCLFNSLHFLDSITTLSYTIYAILFILFTCWMLDVCVCSAINPAANINSRTTSTYSTYMKS